MNVKLVAQSRLLQNSTVDQDSMIEAYKIARRRYAGKHASTESIVDSPHLTLKSEHGRTMPVQLPRTLQQGSATTLVALLDPSIRGNVAGMPTKTS